MISVDVVALLGVGGIDLGNQPRRGRVGPCEWLSGARDCARNIGDIRAVESSEGGVTMGTVGRGLGKMLCWKVLSSVSESSEKV